MKRKGKQKKFAVPVGQAKAKVTKKVPAVRRKQTRLPRKAVAADAGNTQALETIINIHRAGFVDMYRQSLIAGIVRGPIDYLERYLNTALVLGITMHDLNAAVAEEKQEEVVESKQLPLFPAEDEVDVAKLDAQIQDAVAAPAEVVAPETAKDPLNVL